MNEPDVQYRIAVLAHVGVGNLGDELLFASVVEYLRAHTPGVELFGFTMVPSDTLLRHGVSAHAVRPLPAAHDVQQAPKPATNLVQRLVRRIRSALRNTVVELRFAADSIRELHGTRLLLVAGSSNLIDAYGGYSGYPLAFLRWSLFARIRRVPLCYLSMGAETLSSRLSRWMIRFAVSRASYIAVRDPISRERLAEIGITRNIPIVPDLALGLATPLVHHSRASGPKTVGINAIPYFHGSYWRSEDHRRYRRYIEVMTQFTSHILDEGYRVVLYGTTEWADRLASDDVLALLVEQRGEQVRGQIDQPQVNSLSDLWTTVAGLDYVVASRYHGVVTALIMKKPVVALAYEHKTTDLMSSMGLGRYSTDMSTVSADDLIASFKSINENESAVLQQIEAGITACRLRVHHQFEHVLAMGRHQRRI